MRKTWIIISIHIKWSLRTQKYFLKGTMMTVTSCPWVLFSTEFVFVLVFVPGSSEGDSKPWNFQSDRSTSVVHGWPPDSFRMGAGRARKTNHMIRELRLKVTYHPGLLTSWKGRGCWRLSPLTWPVIGSISLRNATSIKNSALKLCWASLVGNVTSVFREGDVFEDMEGFYIGLSQTSLHESFLYTRFDLCF